MRFKIQDDDSVDRSPDLMPQFDQNCTKTIIRSVQAADKKPFDNATYLFTWDIFAMERFI